MGPPPRENEPTDPGKQGWQDLVGIHKGVIELAAARVVDEHRHKHNRV